MSSLPEKTPSEQKPADDSSNNGKPNALPLVGQVSGYHINYTILPQEIYHVWCQSPDGWFMLGRIVDEGDKILADPLEYEPVHMYRLSDSQILEHNELKEAIEQLEAVRLYRAQKQHLEELMNE